jgi:hypothetical protein
MSQPVTLDSLMTDFVCDMVVADDELSDSIFTCVDNFIDDLCLRVMEDENNVFETDRDEGELPFTYIIDKVLERVDTVEDIAIDSYSKVLEKQLSLNGDSEFVNNMDPDYCEEINFDEITPEDFQLYISVPNVDGDADENGVDYTTDDGTNVNSEYDSIFNA